MPKRSLPPQKKSPKQAASISPAATPKKELDVSPVGPAFGRFRRSTGTPMHCKIKNTTPRRDAQF